MAFEYKIEKQIAVLSEKNGYSKEINIVSYNGRPGSYDIRTWYTDENGEKKMTKGITLNADELKKLKEAIKDLEN